MRLGPVHTNKLRATPGSNRGSCLEYVTSETKKTIHRQGMQKSMHIGTKGLARGVESERLTPKRNKVGSGVFSSWSKDHAHHIKKTR
jgi:hypothetical protein